MAATCGATRSVRTGACPPWRDRVRQWSSALSPEQSVRAIHKVLFGLAGWQYLHLHWALPEALRAKPPQRHVDNALAFIQVSAYLSAMAELRQTASDFQRGPDCNFWLAFCEWRTGQRRAALLRLRPFATAETSPGEDQAELKRVYLEILRDEMRSHVHLPQRARLWQEFEGEQVAERLAAIDDQDFRKDLLSRLVLLELEWLRGDVRNVSRVASLVGRASDLQDFALTAAASRVAALVEPHSGWPLLRDSTRKLRQLGKLNTVRQNLVIAAFLVVRHPFVIEWLDGATLGSLKALSIEARLWLRRWLWVVGKYLWRLRAARHT